MFGKARILLGSINMLVKRKFLKLIVSPKILKTEKKIFLEKLTRKPQTEPPKSSHHVLQQHDRSRETPKAESLMDSFRRENF